MKTKIRQYLEERKISFFEFKKELILIEKQSIDLAGKHGMWAGDAHIYSIKILVSVEFVKPKNIILNQIFQCSDYKFEIKSILLCEFCYNYFRGPGTFRVPLNSFKMIKGSKETLPHISFQSHVEGCPSHFCFQKEKDFQFFKKKMQEIYRQLGLKQKGFLY